MPMTDGGEKSPLGWGRSLFSTLKRSIPNGFGERQPIAPGAVCGNEKGDIGGSKH